MAAANDDSPATFATVGPDLPSLGEFDAITIDDDLLLYSRDDEEGWIQCDDYVDLELMA